MPSIITPTLLSTTGWRAGLLRLAGDAVRAAAGLVTAVRHRREVAQLLEMDDRTLKDIGLLRSDVSGVLGAPLTRDPSVMLRLRSVERRARARSRPIPARRVAPAPERCEP